MGVTPFNWNERYSRLEKPGIHSKSLVNFRNNDRKRAEEYKKELEEMNKRIQNSVHSRTLVLLNMIKI